MDITFLNQADSVALQMEKAKRALESAKLELDAAKKAYDEVLTRADELGIPKAKLKKLAEDRVNSLLESGLIDFGPAPLAKVAKDAKPKAKAAKKPRAAGDADHSADGEDPAEAWVAKVESHELDGEDEVEASL